MLALAKVHGQVLLDLMLGRGVGGCRGKGRGLVCEQVGLEQDQVVRADHVLGCQLEPASAGGREGVGASLLPLALVELGPRLAGLEAEADARLRVAGQGRAVHLAGRRVGAAAVGLGELLVKLCVLEHAAGEGGFSRCYPLSPPC